MMRTVSFAVEVEADTPREAAAIFWDVALDYMTAPGIGPGFFEVTDDTGHVEMVELTIEDMVR